jgi:O-methyltransferase
MWSKKEKTKKEEKRRKIKSIKLNKTFMDGQNSVHYILNNQIQGVFVECGVESGNIEETWINAFKRHNQERDIYLFDTFSGLTEPSEKDYTCDSTVLYKMKVDEVKKWWEDHKLDNGGNCLCYCSLDKVRDRLYKTGYSIDKLHFIVGDIRETLKSEDNLPQNIAVLRLDTDWYDSSKYELERLYDRVVKGGLVIFDDYYHWNGQRQATDEFFKERGETVNYIRCNEKTACIIKQ